MAYTIPSDTHVDGDALHTTDHNNIVDVLKGMGAVCNVLNTTYSGGADSSGAADSTAAIQAALTDAASGKGIVYIPPGTYKLSGVLQPVSNVAIIGAGAGVTVLSQTSTTANTIDTTSYGSVLDTVRIENLRINGPNSGSGIGIRIGTNNSANPAVSVTIRNVIVYQMGSHGVECREVITSVLDNVRSVNNGGKGFYIHSNTSGGVSTSVTCISCYANTNPNDRGWHIDDVTYVALLGCAADSNAIGYEISNAGTFGVALTGCGAESTRAGTSGLDGSQFKINAANSVTLTSCYALDTATGAKAFYVTGNSTTCTLISPTELDPQTPGSGYSIAVDSGSYLAVINQNITLSDSIAGTVQNLNDFGYMGVAGEVDITAPGKGLAVAEGSNAKQGTATLNGTTAVVVSNTSVTASSRIFLTINTPGGTPGSPYVSARTAGTSFSIKSTGASDTSTVAYEIFEPG